MKNHYGFTLIELVIILCILTVLAAIAIPDFTQYKIKAMRAQSDYKTVYNVEVEPKKSKDPLVLIPENKTILTFYIGPPSQETVVKLEPSEALDKLAGGNRLDLTITLDCLLCSEKTKQEGKITYYPELHKSGVARFEIVPSKKSVSKSKGLGRLIFTVDAKGIIIDRIQLEAFVGDPTQEALAVYGPPEKLSFKTPPADETIPPDVIIQIGAGGDRGLPILIRPINHDLKEKFEENFPHGSGMDSDRSWDFTSGVTQNDLEDLVPKIYLAFRTIVTQNETIIQRFYQKVGVDMTITSGGLFEDRDREKILNALREHGTNLYWRLFEEGATADLTNAMHLIDAFRMKNGRPLRVDIWATNVYAPWQILYPSAAGKVDQNKFWGFRYELGTMQQVDGAPGRQLNSVKVPTAEEVLFAGWRGADGKDDVAELAKMLGGYFWNRFGKSDNQAFNRMDFVEKLRKRANQVKFLLAYGHGSSGTVIRVEPTSTSLPTIETDLGGPRFEFSDNDWVLPVDIDELNHKDDVKLRLQPIVILSACESGAYGVRPMNNNGFVGALTRMGAGAVLVTEGPVWPVFAYNFDRNLIDELMQGHEMRSAMYNVRHKYLTERKNPLGLLYTFYGNPAVHFER